MDLDENTDLNRFVPAPFRIFSGFVPEPTVQKGQGSPVMETNITDNDVLLGRGYATDCHNGNIQFRYIVLRTATQNCEKIFARNEKTFESSKVVAIIRNLKPSGRFLSKNEKSGCWEEVGDIVARKKASQAFRDCRYAAIKKVNGEYNWEPKGLNQSQTDECTRKEDQKSSLSFMDLQANNEFVNCKNASYQSISNKDILLGRGKCKLYGNVMLRQLIAESLTKFYEGPERKSSIAVDEIIGKMRNTCPPIRFLCQNKKTGLWEDAGVNVTRAKVAQAFQDFHNDKVKEAKAEKDLEVNEMGHFPAYELHLKADLAPNTSKTSKQVLANKKEPQCLNKNDILLGRGSWKHLGNIMLRHLVNQNLEKYYNEPSEKAILISEIMATLKNLNPPGRFMSQNKKTGVWEEAQDIKSQLKVAQAFRDCHYTVMRKSNTENNPYQSTYRRSNDH